MPIACQVAAESYATSCHEIFIRILELESQLENAQGRCDVLEKQLEYMRKTMQDQQQQQHNLSARSAGIPVSSRRADTISESSPRYSITTAQQLATHASPEHRSSRQQTASPPTYRNPHMTIVEETPALEKLNDLEREHLKLTASQNQTEVSYYI